LAVGCSLDPKAEDAVVESGSDGGNKVMDI
jgi:hypothetical protein